MVKFQRYKLDNGLTLIVNEDFSTPLIAINMLYQVGSRDERPGKTGFAHLFEHLMFGGSRHISSFDEPLQLVGGENNAFTSSDITNYYITLPSDNIETGLWLESDRMLALDFSEERLKVQQNVVTEEYHQRYLNQPYGDIWLMLRPLAYKVHPYRWPTIGEHIEHIQQANLEDVKSFFYSHYAPNNAILTLSGNITHKTALHLVKNWFNDIESRPVVLRNLPVEPVQSNARSLTVNRPVQFDAIYKAWHIPGRLDKDYYLFELVTDLLAGGQSSRLYQDLVKGQKLFNEINAYITGEIDPGLLIIGGKLMKGVDIEKANRAIMEKLEEFMDRPVDDRELKKVQNRFETTILQGHSNILNKAMGLSYYEMLGNADLINQEILNYCSVLPGTIRSAAPGIFNESNCSTLYYLTEK
jgi:predicted Zn-dependent peptidase